MHKDTANYPGLIPPAMSLFPRVFLTAAEAYCHLGAWLGWQTASPARMLLPPSRQLDPGP